MIIDSHCHLDFPNLYNDLEGVIKRANINEVKYLLSICTTLKSFETIKEIINNHDNIYGTFGIHPHETKDFKNINSQFIINSVKSNKKIIGIGETGLDYYYNHSDKLVQRKCFYEHIKASSELDMPLIVHTRNAEEDTYDLLKSEMKNCNLKVLIHCFTGTVNFAKKLINLDCFISLSGIITFKKSINLVDAVSYIPINKLLVETDSPYLSPEPNRGKSNEPANIIHTVEKLSKIKNVSKDVIIKSTTENFFKIFNIK
jgi:TatD DNase family protein